MHHPPCGRASRLLCDRLSTTRRCSSDMSEGMDRSCECVTDRMYLSLSSQGLRKHSSQVMHASRVQMTSQRHSAPCSVTRRRRARRRPAPPPPRGSPRARSARGRARPPAAPRAAAAARRPRPECVWSAHMVSFLLLQADESLARLCSRQASSVRSTQRLHRAHTAAIALNEALPALAPRGRGRAQQQPPPAAR